MRNAFAHVRLLTWLLSLAVLLAPPLAAAEPAASAQRATSAAPAGAMSAAEPAPPAPPAATAPPPGSPFRVDLRVDLPLTAAALVAGLMPELFKGELARPSCGLSCDPASVNALDRTVIGNRSPGAQVVSDVFLGAAIALPFGADLLDVLVTRPRDGARGLGADALVLAETFALNFLVNNVVKYAVARPRPLAYDPQFEEEKRLDPDAALSFYSGHSSTAFAMATAYSYLFMKRHPRSRWVIPVWILSEGLAASTAFLRVHAGKHFYTDVLTGAAVGAAAGLLIPVLHHRALAGSAVRLAPTAYAGGVGLSLTVSN